MILINNAIQNGLYRYHVGFIVLTVAWLPGFLALFDVV